MNKFKTAILGAALTAAGLVAAVPAQASVYFGSRLDIQNLTVTFLDEGSSNTQVGPDTFPKYTFNIKNNAQLIPDGTIDAQGNNCDNLLGTTTCNDSGGTVLQSPAANGSGANTVTRGDTDYSFFGPGTDEYANSNSEITSAALVDGTPTATIQVSEAELQSSGTSTFGTSDTTVTSTTTFQFTFVIEDGIVGPVTMVLAFKADPDQTAIVDVAADGGIGLATFDVNATVKLSQQNGDSAEWTPTGTTVNSCTATGSLVCTEDNDTQSLNVTDTAGLADGQVSNSWDPNDVLLTDFGITVNGLSAGEWSLTLTAKTDGSVRIVREVPEPSMLLLIGTGFMVGGIAAARRRKKASA